MRLPQSTNRRLAILGAVGALLVGAFALPALAQNATDAPSESATEDATTPEHPFAARKAVFVEALADELGISVDRVEAAIAAARGTVAEQWADERTARLQERLDQAVADGELTQEQADAILEAAEAGVLPGVGRGFRGHGFGFGHRGQRFEDWHSHAPEDAGSPAEQNASNGQA